MNICYDYILPEINNFFQMHGDSNSFMCSENNFYFDTHLWQKMLLDEVTRSSAESK